MFIPFMNWFWWVIYTNIDINNFIIYWDKKFIVFFQNPYIVDTLQNFGLVLVTFLFTFFIALLGKSLGKPDEEEVSLDKYITFPFILDPVYFLSGLIFIYLPFLFWNDYSSYQIKAFILFWVLIGLLIFFIMISQFFEWLLDYNRNSFRLKFIRFYVDNVKYWKKMVEIPDQEGMYKIFIKRINKVLDKKDFNKFSIGDFVRLLKDSMGKNNNYSIFEIDDYFLDLVNISFRLFEYQKKKNNSHYLSNAITQVNLLINEYYRFIEKKSDYILFDIFSDNINKIYNKAEKINKVDALKWISDFDFWNYLMSFVYNNGEFIREKFYLPDTWKINKKNIQNNTPSTKLWRVYGLFIQRKITKNKYVIDTNLDRITNIFVNDVDIVLWGIMLSFFWDFSAEDSAKKKVKRYINNVRPFGNDLYNIEEDLFDKTIELLFILLKNETGFSDLDLYITELNNMKDLEQEKETKRIQLLKVLSALKEMGNLSKKEQS